jgi:hypothetical protein
LRACFADGGSSVSAQTASAWLISTGIRTQVALIGRSGSSTILRVSARSFDSSSNLAFEVPVHREASCSGSSHRERDRAAVPIGEDAVVLEGTLARSPWGDQRNSVLQAERHGLSAGQLAPLRHGSRDALVPTEECDIHLRLSSASGVAS